MADAPARSLLTSKRLLASDGLRADDVCAREPRRCGHLCFILK
jgi:hypothetical protein